MREFDADKCSGCRICELACSWHHKRVFAPSAASIQIFRDDHTGKVRVILYDKPQDGHLACNCPVGEENCVEYCPAGLRAELIGIFEKWNIQE